MTKEEVAARVAAVAGMVGDPEVAHSREDDLFVDVLIAIADGAADNPAELARAALETQELDFPRWCA